MEHEFTIGSGEITHRVEVERGELRLVRALGERDAVFEVRGRAPSDPEILRVKEVVRQVLLLLDAQRASGINMSTREAVDAVLDKMP